MILKVAYFFYIFCSIDMPLRLTPFIFSARQKWIEKRDWQKKSKGLVYSSKSLLRMGSPNKHQIIWTFFWGVGSYSSPLLLTQRS